MWTCVSKLKLVVNLIETTLEAIIEWVRKNKPSFRNMLIDEASEENS